MELRKRPKNPRARRLKIEAAILEAAGTNWPKSIRHIYYELVAAHVIKKTRSEYVLMDQYATDLRREGMLPWYWIVDGTREAGGIPWEKEEPPRVEASIDLEFFGDLWRPPVWQYRQPPIHVELWCETRGMGASLANVAALYGVGTTACGGKPSASLVYDAWVSLQQQQATQQVEILFVGDADQAGYEIEEQIQAEFAQTFDTRQ